jgi:hypothetical protein
MCSVLVGRLLLPLLVFAFSAVDAGRRPDNECSVLVGIVVAAVGVCVSAVDVTLVEFHGTIKEEEEEPYLSNVCMYVRLPASPRLYPCTLPLSISH